MQKKPIVIGIAGGSGSGKTYFAQALAKYLGPEHCALVYQDNYYMDLSSRFDFDGGSVNFDHPSSIDFQLLKQHLEHLKLGQSVEVPQYDFKTHKRLEQTTPLLSKKYIIVDGILIFTQKELVPLFDQKVFVDTSEELRFERRLKRDILERGRSAEGVKNQFDKQVKPMHDLFVEPSKACSDYVVNEKINFSYQLFEFIEKVGF